MSVKTAALSKPLYALQKATNDVQTLASAALSSGGFDDETVLILEADAVNKITYVLAYLQSHSDVLEG